MIVSLAAASAQFAFATSWNPLTSTINWVENSTGLGAGYGLWLVADPYDYRRYFALMSDGLYRNNDPKNGSAWALVASNATIFGDAARIGKCIEMSINRQGYIAISTGINTFAYSTDYAATWNKVSINGAANNYGTSVTDTAQVKFAISPFNNGTDGRIYALTFSSNFFKYLCYRSEDWGATWASVCADAFGEVELNGDNYSIVGPYRRPGGTDDNINDASQVVYASAGVGHSSNGGKIKKTANAGVNWGNTLALAASGIMVPSGAYIGRAIQTFTYDAAYLAAATLKTGAGSVATGIRISADQGATALYNGALWDTYSCYYFLGVNGYPIHSQFWIVWARAQLGGTNENNAIKWTPNNGTTWYSAAPPTFFTGNKFCANVQADISSLVPPA